MTEEYPVDWHLRDPLQFSPIYIRKGPIRTILKPHLNYPSQLGLPSRPSGVIMADYCTSLDRASRAAKSPFIGLALKKIPVCHASRLGHIQDVGHGVGGVLLCHLIEPAIVIAHTPRFFCLLRNLEAHGEEEGLMMPSCGMSWMDLRRVSSSSADNPGTEQGAPSVRM